MSAMDKVKKIEADIAALPAEYRALFQKEQTWAQANPLAYAGALLVIGGVLLQVARWIFHV